MRRFLSLFMVLLLALRGLAGDAMAMEQKADSFQLVLDSLQGICDPDDDLPLAGDIAAAYARLDHITKTRHAVAWGEL